MNVMNCRSCGRLFNAITNARICPQCQKDLEDKFQVVKKYLYEFPDSNMDTLSKECDVTIKQLKQWVREERLTFREGSMDGVECEQCGTLIRTGRYCDSCKQRITNNLMGAVERPKRQDGKRRERDGDRMRFL